MVEMAIVLSLFLALVFGIMEFAIAYFTWHRAAEGARNGLRYALVSEPAVPLTLDCEADPNDYVVTSDPCDGDCLPVLQKIQRVAPFVQGNNVNVTYACSNTGNPDLPVELLVPEVRVKISGLTYTFVVPGLFGIGSTLDLPTITVSRTGEDLFTSGS